ILALAEFRKESLGSAARKSLAATLGKVFRTDPDAGVHSAAELILRRWAALDELKFPGEPPRSAAEGGRRWYINRVGLTMVEIDGPLEFRMGAPPDDPDRESEEVYHRRQIPRRFAIATQEVTVADFQRFAREKRGRPHLRNIRYSPHADGPQNSVSWY